MNSFYSPRSDFESVADVFQQEWETFFGRKAQIDLPGGTGPPNFGILHESCATKKLLQNYQILPI
jgi:hypothetical protein